MRGRAAHAKDAQIPEIRGAATMGSNERSPSWEEMKGGEVPASGPN